MHAEAVADGLFRRLPVYPGARDAIIDLCNKGAEIVVITARMIQGTDPQQVEEDTRFWLHTNGIPVDEVHFSSNKPEIMCDVYIDDAPHNIHALNDAGRNVVVFNQPYNETLLGHPRARNWEQGFSLLNTARSRWLHDLYLKQAREQTAMGVFGYGAPGGYPVGPETVRLPQKPQSLVSRLFAKRCNALTVEGRRCKNKGNCPAHSL